MSELSGWDKIVAENAQAELRLEELKACGYHLICLNELDDGGRLTGFNSERHAGMIWPSSGLEATLPEGDGFSSDWEEWILNSGAWDPDIFGDDEDDLDWPFGIVVYKRSMPAKILRVVRVPDEPDSGDVAGV